MKLKSSQTHTIECVGTFYSRGVGIKKRMFSARFVCEKIIFPFQITLSHWLAADLANMTENGNERERERENPNSKCMPVPMDKIKLKPISNGCEATNEFMCCQHSELLENPLCCSGRVCWLFLLVN